MLGFLERDSLVKIQPSPTDGRSRIIELTHQGQALFETAEPLWREAQRQFEQINGTENARALRAELTDMVVGYAVAL
jgi:DNA-binding MarR family transcriptional regulator